MTLNEFIASDYFQAYEHDFWNTNIFLDPDYKNRIDAIMEARETGCDGRTHGEILDFQFRALCCAYYDNFVTEGEYDNIEKEIFECMNWHVENDSIDQET